MAIINPPIFFGLASHQYPANRVRRLIAGLLHGVDGVAAPGHLSLAPTTPASMSLTLSPGSGFVTGTAIAGQGIYMVENDAPLVVGPFAPVASGARVDLVVARVRDGAADGGGDQANAASFEIVQGVEAATPAPPAVPASSLVLGQVLVSAGDTTVAASAISRRPTIAGAPPSPTMVAGSYGPLGTVMPSWDVAVQWTGGAPMPGVGRWLCSASVPFSGAGTYELAAYTTYTWPGPGPVRTTRGTCSGSFVLNMQWIAVHTNWYDTVDVRATALNADGNQYIGTPVSAMNLMIQRVV